MSALRRVAIVGASLAGLRAAEALRRRGYDGDLVMIGAEPHRPYDRPPLSKQILRGDWPPERALFRRDQGYEELEVDLRLGQRAVRLDARERRVVLDTGGEVDFDGLIIATGTTPRALPGAPPGVYVLRTLDDSLALRDELDRSPRVAVVGGGFIGLEVAAVCRQRGLQVCVVEAQPLPLQGIVGDEMARAIMDIHESEGVTFRCGVSVTGFVGQDRVSGLTLSDGSSVTADVVVVGIGVYPETAWLEGSGLEVQDGIVCDATCATAIDGIVAAGDVVRWYNPLFARSMRVEHWTNAVEQAGKAVERLLQGPSVSALATVPYFWSDQYDAKIQFAGAPRASDSVRVVQRASDARKLVAVYEDGSRLTGVLAINSPAQMVAYRRQMATGAA